MRRPMRKLGESSECSAALGIPKVALLFLTPGDMPLEEVRPLLKRTPVCRPRKLLLATDRGHEAILTQT